MFRPWLRFVGWFALALVLVLPRAGADDASGAPLVIGMELNYPPFEMTDASGTPCGVGVEMAQALAAYLPCCRSRTCRSRA
jgi:ABC-type amino acid transport substrate-binding protein